MSRTLIIEDLAEARRWLYGIAQAAFPTSPEIDVAATVQSGLAFASRHDYAVALIDLKLPDGSGIDVLRALRRQNADTLCVVTTVMGDDAHIVAALSAGANGYLLKEQPADMIIRQLAQLSEGVPALSPAIARRIMAHFQLTGPAAAPEEDLTDREREVLALISRGMRNLDVSEQLSLSVNTVATHIKSVYRKLGISSRAEASWHATMLGLVPGQTKKTRTDVDRQGSKRRGK
ncbi:LuxR C-terminal-related transcriptional regulator [Pusillimonas noertemannii]|uniref:LuxR family two component transcriptional regulator n=1 Tax=Pusillimonas noertemannii TaxID=305977 RepID=A0A2U1CPB6_9BURK|nr:response regulator transcription factor [Pusillimonas noertemannii]NYT67059.1 response regulator transcription factor [Pusillimonas noertemannii]PVY67733.1 LuxR family two component transcriptional regulator [Pusillimonas noertemannii]TFL12735.1 response regulator transcription factor [Pusillimonas noertemannii]